LVSFGLEPAKIDNSLVEMLRRREIDQMDQPRKIFSPGDRVQLAGIPFAGVEGIYQMAEGEQRVMVLIELLSRPVSVVVPQWSLRKVG
jgi:transcriptional antiterminator RfaH